MNIYQFLYSLKENESDNDEDCFVFKTEKDDGFFLDNLSKGKYSKLLNKKIYLDSCGNPKQYDFPWICDDGILCNEKAYLKLKEFLKHCGGWNTFYFDDEKYYYFSTTKILPALDMDKTKLLIEDGIDFGVDEYVFRDSIDYSKYPIFRIEYLPTSPPYVTQDFVNFVEKNELTGLRFFEPIGH